MAAGPVDQPVGAFPVLAALAPVITDPANELAYPGDPMCLYSALAFSVAQAELSRALEGGPTAPYPGLRPDWGPPPSKRYRLTAPESGIRSAYDGEPNSDQAIFDPRVWTDDTIAAFREQLRRRRPRLVLISTVSAGHRYALHMATITKRELPECLVILGGRHIDETVRVDAATGAVEFAHSSTVAAIADGRVPPVVDFLVSGEGAYALDLLLRAISAALPDTVGRVRVADAVAQLHRLRRAGERPKGKAVVVALDGAAVRVFRIDGAPYTLVELPSPYAAFAIRSRFPVFPGPNGVPRRTAHMMTSVSCPYRCSFCSESVRVTGNHRRFGGTETHVLARVCEYVHYGAEAVFFDDPVFCAGNFRAMTRFCELLAAARADPAMLPDVCREWLRDPDDLDRLTDLRWGMQFTADLLTTVHTADDVENLLAVAARAGCHYVYLGLESMSTTVMAGVHKNLRHEHGPTWPVKVRTALTRIKRAGISTGTSVLFGLDGETRATIDETIEQVGRLLDDGLLDLASPNVLTYHPAAGITGEHGMSDRIDYHSMDVRNRAPYTHFEEAYPGVVSKLLSEDDIWQIHRLTEARWGSGLHRPDPDRPAGHATTSTQRGEPMSDRITDTTTRPGTRPTSAGEAAEATRALRPRHSMLSLTSTDSAGDEVQLWCDPLTGLVAYPSFAEHLTLCLPALAPKGVHLAIGDVDDLKEYVTQRRADDPTCFGHLAGNECMRTLGQVTAAWASRTLVGWPFALCGTFGGDEVIIAAAGGDYAEFRTAIGALSDEIGRSVPRTCSFAAGTLMCTGIEPADRETAYREFISQIDIALFAAKARCRAESGRPHGDFEDVGAVHVTVGSAGPSLVNAAPPN